MDYKFLLESILEHLDEGILVVDQNANVTFYNESATNIAGITQKKAMDSGDGSVDSAEK